MEPEFSEPMLFQQRGGATQDSVFDPAQVLGVQSTVPKLSVPLALKDVKSPESSALGLSSVYEYKRLLAYLKVNSRDRPLKNRTFTLNVSVGVSRGYTDYHQGRAIHRPLIPL